MERERLEFIIEAVNRTQSGINAAIGDIHRLQHALAAANRMMQGAVNATGSGYEGLQSAIREVGSVLLRVSAIARGAFGVIGMLSNTVGEAVGRMAGKMSEAGDAAARLARQPASPTGWPAEVSQGGWQEMMTATAVGALNMIQERMGARMGWMSQGWRGIWEEVGSAFTGAARTLAATAIVAMAITDRWVRSQSVLRLASLSAAEGFERLGSAARQAIRSVLPELERLAALAAAVGNTLVIGRPTGRSGKRLDTFPGYGAPWDAGRIENIITQSAGGRLTMSSEGSSGTQSIPGLLTHLFRLARQRGVEVPGGRAGDLQQRLRKLRSAAYASTAMASPGEPNAIAESAIWSGEEDYRHPEVLPMLPSRRMVGTPTVSVEVNVDAHLRDLPGAVGREVERKMAQWLQTTYGTAEAVG